MNSLEEFLNSKRAIVNSRQSGWIKATSLLALHEKREKILTQNDGRRKLTTAASHRRKIEKRILDLQTLTVDISPIRGSQGELIITVKTDDFPRPIPIRRFFTNALYLPAFQITKHYLFRLMIFIGSVIRTDAEFDEGSYKDSPLFDFVGWDGKKAVITVGTPKESGSRNGKGKYYLISPIENGKFAATEIIRRVVRTAVHEDPDPASAIRKAEAWISKNRPRTLIGK